MLQSIAAVLAGFVVMAIAVMAGTVALTAVLIPGGVNNMRSPERGAVAPLPYLIANLTLSVLAAMLGGWLTAGIAQSAPLIHVLVLAAFVFCMGVVSARQAGGKGNRPGQPGWYPWTITMIGTAGVLIGGMLRARP